ncbi:ABC transporter permease [Patescibacteria group bacterium]|nr:ABC transporter permease [Patescibacteria group bacterium]
MNTYLRRIIKAGFLGFWRNGWVSLTALMTMVLALFMIGSLLFSNVLLTSALSRIENQVDISVYFQIDITEEEIINVKSALSQLAQVKIVTYISRDEALEKFKARHAGNALITQSLDELDENPLEASLNVQAKNPDQYEVIARFLADSAFSTIINKVNYFQNEVVIERLSGILAAARGIGLGITAVLAIIAMLVVLNTIRLTIYTNRDEISVMKLVGASRKYIRGPFLVEGALYGIISAVITMIAFYPLTLWLGPAAAHFFGGVNLFHYYLSNFFQILLILLVSGIMLGIVSSAIAIRRYLKV